MIYEVKEKFLWFNKGQELDEEDLAKYKPEHIKMWVEKGHVAQMGDKEEAPKEEAPEGALDRIKDFAEDIMDDGKRNRSNKSKKSKKKKK